MRVAGVDRDREPLEALAASAREEGKGPLEAYGKTPGKKTGKHQIRNCFFNSLGVRVICSSILYN